MAITQQMPPTMHDYETQGSSHDSSSSSSSSAEKSFSCSEFEGEHGKTKMIVKRISRRTGLRRSRASSAPSLNSSRTCSKNSRRAQISHPHPNAIANSNANASAHSMRMMKRLHFHLASLGSLLPPTARSSRTSSVIADALRYRKALEKEIQLLLAAIPNSHQVDVRRVECGGLQIGIECKKKSGLMVALMEAMESFGLLFTNVNVSCQDDNITIDALSTQDSGEKAGAVKGMLIATITRFSQRQ